MKSSSQLSHFKFHLHVRWSHLLRAPLSPLPWVKGSHSQGYVSKGSVCICTVLLWWLTSLTYLAAFSLGEGLELFVKNLQIIWNSSCLTEIPLYWGYPWEIQLHFLSDTVLFGRVMLSFLWLPHFFVPCCDSLANRQTHCHVTSVTSGPKNLSNLHHEIWGHKRIWGQLKTATCPLLSSHTLCSLSPLIFFSFPIHTHGVCI